MNEIDKFWLEKLIDTYGFTFKTAKGITEQSNADYIIDCISIAYKKGKKDGTPTYNYSGGL